MAERIPRVRGRMRGNGPAANAQDHHRAAVHDRAPVHPGQRRQPGRRPRSPDPPDELKRLYRAMLLARRFDERMVRLQRQGRIGTFAPIKGQEAAQIGSVAALRRTDWMVPVLPRDRVHALARLAHREAPALLLGLSRGRPARARSARPPDLHPGRHPAPARGGPGLRRAVPRRRRGGHGVLRRRRHLRGRLPRGHELRGRLARAGGLHRAEQPVGDLDAAQEADPLAHHRPEGARLRLPGPPGGRQRRARGVRGQPRGGRAGAPRRRPDPHRVRHLSPGRAHHRRRSHQVPLGRGGGGVGAEGSAHPLPRLSREAEPAGARPGGGGRRGDRARRGRLRGGRAAGSARHVRPRLRQPAGRARRPARRDGGAARPRRRNRTTGPPPARP